MKKLPLLFCLLGIVSCDPLKRVNTEGFYHFNEYIIYKQDTVAKLVNLEYSLDNGKLTREATFKLLDSKYGDKSTAIIAFIHNSHKGWEVELDYPVHFPQPVVK